MFNKTIVYISTILVLVSLICLFTSIKLKKKSITINENPEPFSDKILILLCYANWCKNCQSIEPIFKVLTEKQPIDDVVFDMIEESDKSRYIELTKDITGYPTLIIDDGHSVSTFIGINKINDVLKRFDLIL